MHSPSYAAAAILVLTTSAIFAADPRLERYEVQHRAMGTVFQITLYAADEAQAKRGFAAATQRIDALNATLSDYDPESELSRLSAAAPTKTPVPVSDDLWNVLVAAQEISRATGGAFDVTIGPLTTLWREARKTKKLPSAAAIAEARKSVGYEHLRLHPKAKSVELLRPNMRLDLGGIAKGFAVDAALVELDKQAITRALVAGSGDIGVSDPPPGIARHGWNVGVAPLELGGPVTRTLTLKQRAVSTSGDLWQYVEIDGKRYSHIVDPKTGYGLTERASVTVVAPTSTAADAWASAVCVLGPQRGFEAADKVFGIGALVVRKEGDKTETLLSAGMKTFLAREESLPNESGEAETHFGGKPLSHWQRTVADFDAKSPDAAEAVPALTAIVQDRKIDVVTRRHAALALGAIGKGARSAVPTLVHTINEPGDGDEPPGVWSIKALSRMGEHAQDATPAIVSVLHDPKRPAVMRMVCLEALARIRGAHPAAMAALVKLVGQETPAAENASEEERLRELAVEAIAAAGVDAAVTAPLLMRIATNPREAEPIRRRAVTALGVIGARPEVVGAALMEALALDESPAVRDLAATSLGQLGASAEPILIRLLEHDDAGVRWRAAKSLAALGENARASTKPLTTLLADPDAEVRINAAESLWKLNARPAPLLDPTVELLQCPDRRIRFRALNLFHQLGPSRASAAPALEKLKSHPELYVRQAAEKALEKLAQETPETAP